MDSLLRMDRDEYIRELRAEVERVFWARWPTRSVRRRIQRSKLRVTLGYDQGAFAELIQRTSAPY